MATSFQMWLLVSLFVVLACVPGVLCDDYNIGGLVAAAVVAFILLAVVIAMIATGLTWNNWYPKLQWDKGRVKMPRVYWKKREEAKRRLLHGSRSGLASPTAPSESGLPLPNGHSTPRVRDTASWVQGWNNANNIEDHSYEEIPLAMDLRDEREEEVGIETTVVDNESLDLGPYSVVDTASVPYTSAAATANTSASAGAIGIGAASANSEQSATMEMMEEETGDSSVVDRSLKKSVTSRSSDHGDVESAHDA
ncbi:hypothetical protein ACOMHN_058432 [Nucella lapillus]